jgi:outer membrane protein insertion porin family
MIRRRCQNILRLLLGTLTFFCALLCIASNVHAQSGSRGAPGFGQQPEFRQSEDAQRRRSTVPYFGPQTDESVAEIKIVGNSLTSEKRVLSMIKTRVGRAYDSELVQMDVRELIGSGLFRDVRTYRRETKSGVSITFEVFERPVVAHVRFIGNKKVKDKSLIKEVGVKAGDPLNRFTIEEGRRRIEQHYKDNGFGRAKVSIVEGIKPGESGIAYRIHEGPKQRVRAVDFIGNTFVGDARLKTKIESKPGILWLIGGKVNYDQVDEDVDRLYAYYRSYGYFRCRIGRKLAFDDDNEWLKLTFVIDEGPRYTVRNVIFNGNEKYVSSALASELELRQGKFFNLAQMQRDLSTMRDLYGGEGHIFADIRAEPKFDEHPGEIDLVYNFDEGDQYRVGRILVNIDGDETHTRRTVVLNRLSFRPGDVVDVREIRASERRLASSQLFLHNPAQGVSPKIAVKPPENDTQIARHTATASGGTFRGQSPRHLVNRPVVHYADIHVTGKAKPTFGAGGKSR